MKFYNKLHKYYCGIDLHARMLYVCIIDDKGNKVVHQKIKDSPAQLLSLLKPYCENVVVGVECMHCWYWVSDFCDKNDIEFILGHALYMRAIHGGKTKNDKIDSFKIANLLRGGNFPIAYAYPKLMRATRDLLRRRTRLVRRCADMKAHISNTLSQYNKPAHNLDVSRPAAKAYLKSLFEDGSTQRNIDLDLNVIAFYSKELQQVERYILNQAKQHNTQDYTILTSFPGIGKILGLTILYEIGDIARFNSVQNFASYARLIKCKAESAGKIYGTSGNKIGNAHLKWAFSEAAVLYLKNSDDAKKFLKRLQKRMSKAKALSALAHKIGRCVFFMLKNKVVFDEQRFLTS